jgi:hypothetical protein
MTKLVAIALGLGGALLVVGAQAHHVEPPKPPAVTVVRDDSSALAEVLLHYVPAEEDKVRDTYRDFLGTLSPATHVVAVHPPGERAKLDAFLTQIDPGLPARTRAVEVQTPLGIWSKDRALVLASPGTSRAEPVTFLIPPRPRAGESGRPFDWDIVPAVAAAAPDRFKTREWPVAFDAGDFAIAGKRVLFDANLYARNRGRGYPSAAAFKAKMASLMGRDVVMLGASEGDVPRHHMSMYMAPVDGPDGTTTMLVGDPAMGTKIVGPNFMPGERGLESGQLLEADASPETQARFDRAAHDLELAGYKVVRIPTVAFEDKTYFAYTNGIYETRDGKKIAWMPTFTTGDDPLVADLDTAARAVYERLGYEVRPVTVRRLYTSHGTIGCVVNVLRRDSRVEPRP